MQTDTIIQNLFTIIKKIKWRDCETDSSFQWYYAEECHYIVNEKATGAYWFVKAKSPDSACEIVLKKVGKM